MTNPLRTLQEYGQSVWLDFLSRDLFRSGELKRLIAEDGLRGMTSNPSIFEKAIGHGEDYDAQIAELEASGDLDPGTLFERLAVTDIQSAGDPHKVASVASFFVSRIDTMVDEALDKKIAAANDPAEKARLKGLQGKIAIANAKLAYQLYQRIFRDERWQRLAQHGAQTQRLLWASTGTKNKAYSDVLYVEELIGPDTVNTMPPATMEAFRDHGRLRPSLQEDVAGAAAVMEALASAGISIDDITARLVDDGVQLFAEAADHLYAAVQKKRRTVLDGKLNAISCKLPKELDEAVKAALEDWRKEGKVRRLWEGDASLWTKTDEAQWLGRRHFADAQPKKAREPE